ncbi:MAG: GNAT family N-acetyltransferase [Dehalococcoidia bacterium]
MAVEFRVAIAEDVPELGRICYEAFKDISERHGFEPDFPSVELASLVVGLLVQNEDVQSVAAVDGGVLRGSNFLNMWGDIGGIGPISVDPGAQGEGIGRKLMLDALAHAAQQGVEMVRLCQDAFNMQSLALYASVGFVVREPLAYLALSTAGPADADCRPGTADDLDAMEELSRRVYGVSRRGEGALLMQLGFPCLVRERGGRVRGYLLGTAMGHGLAESDADLLALMASMGASTEDAHAFVPMRNGELYRQALAAGHRNQKVMNLMSVGPYEEPVGTWAPSVMF